MRKGTTVLTLGGLLLLAGCTRTIIVREPAPDTDRRGSRPPPRSYPEPERPNPNPPPPNTAVLLGVPPGHLPDPGECRVWVPGTPPGRQPRPRSRPCTGILAVAPAGSWIIYRPGDDRRVVHVRVVDERRPGFVIRIRIFDIASEQLVREEEPQDEQRRDDRPREERRPPPAEDQRPPEYRPRDDAGRLGVPPGHLPDPGECRVWIPGAPPGQQPPPRSRPCEGIAAVAPAGSWIVYRPGEDLRVVHVRVVDARRPGIVTRIRIFDIASEQLVREEEPPQNEERPRPLDQRPDIQPPIGRPPEPRPPAQQPPPENKPPEQRPPEQRPPENKPPEQPPPAQRPPEQRPPEQRPPEQRPPEQRPPEQRPPENKPPEQPRPDQRPPEQPPGPNTAVTLDVPPGHLPDPGECRVWIPGTPPGQQPKPKSRPCAGVAAAAPAGSWILYRPGQDRSVVHVRVVDARRAGVVIRVQVFDIESKRLLREENP
ncbi:MAG TPA: hypothetical protein VGQ25_04430 [Gemmatimonadales bacterium]|nr:hypothetical protein [Gemmatimonadales bacterium]